MYSVGMFCSVMKVIIIDVHVLRYKEVFLVRLLICSVIGVALIQYDQSHLYFCEIVKSMFLCYWCNEIWSFDVFAKLKG